MLDGDRADCQLVLRAIAARPTACFRCGVRVGAVRGPEASGPRPWETGARWFAEGSLLADGRGRGGQRRTAPSREQCGEQRFASGRKRRRSSARDCGARPGPALPRSRSNGFNPACPRFRGLGRMLWKSSMSPPLTALRALAASVCGGEEGPMRAHSYSIATAAPMSAIAAAEPATGDCADLREQNKGPAVPPAVPRAPVNDGSPANAGLRAVPLRGFEPRFPP
jgi:hypothetical protein